MVKKIFLVLFMTVFSIEAATFTVINTNDSGAGSLRQAILDANAAGGSSTVNFNIPGAAPQIIVPTTFNSTTPPRAQVYQPLTNDSIIIDATTQPGYVFGSPSVVINCATIAAAGNSGSCIFIQGANNCVIKGLGICNYVGSESGVGISIENTATQGAMFNQITQCVLGSIATVPPFGNTRGLVMTTRFTPTSNNQILNNIIGGPGATDGNVLSGNAIAGLQAQLGVNATTIENNFIGSDSTGTVAVGNASGLVFIGDPETTGQSGPCNNNIVQNNVISGNTGENIVLQALCTGNIIENNMIGVNASGTATLGSAQMGIMLNGAGPDGTNNNTIQNNIIGGNGDGIYITDNASNNIINNNYIGTNSAGTNLANGGSGIVVQGAADGPCLANLFQTNTIQFNGFTGTTGLFTTTHDAEPRIIPPNGGVRLGAGDNFGIFLMGDPSDPDILNAMLANNISFNDSNGIELQNNSNDNQIPPTLNSAGVCLDESALTISITAPATPAASNFRLDLFVNTVDRNPITEGARFIGSIASVPSGQTVTQTFIVTSPNVVPGNFISATATNLNNAGGPGDTSEYTLNTLVATFIPPTINSLTASPNPICFGDPSTLTLSFTPGTSSGPFFAQWSDAVMQTVASSPFTRIVSPPITTTYSALLSDSFTCTAESMMITVTVNPLPFITLTASETTIAVGQSVMLIATPSGNGPFTLDWSDGVVDMMVTGSIERTVSPAFPTTYTVTAIDSNGCRNSASVFIIVGKISPIAFAIFEKYCPGA